MREVRVKEWAESLPTRDLYQGISHVLWRTPGAGQSFDPLLEALHLLLERPTDDGGLPEALRCDLYTQASDAGDTRLLRLLRPGTPARSPEGPLDLPRDLADIPLGRRRSLAKGVERRLLEQLAQDPDPGVITNLLQNPRIREADVVKLAAARPVAASTLEVIGRDPRFGQQVEVRLCLARNPYAPLALALRMQNGLPLCELREIARDGTLHQEVRNHASEGVRTREAPRFSADAPRAS